MEVRPLKPWLVDTNSRHEKREDGKKGPDISATCCAHDGNPIVNSTTSDPAVIVQRQLDAFNARDLDAFVATYADDGALFEHPDKLLARGSAALRERFAVRFSEPNLHATLLHRIVANDIVVDHERIARTFPEGPGTIEATMVYEVKAGRISRSWMIVGPKVLAKG